MEQITAIKVFESLSSGIRLDIYRLLVKYGMEGMVAGQVGTMLDIPPTNLSFHLKEMTQSKKFILMKLVDNTIQDFTKKALAYQ